VHYLHFNIFLVDMLYIMNLILIPFYFHKFLRVKISFMSFFSVNNIQFIKYEE